MPHLKTAGLRFKDRFEILAISGDDTRDAVRRLAAKTPLPGIQTWDVKNGNAPVAELYNVSGFPTWYLLDPKGIIRAKDPLGKKLLPAIEAALTPFKSSARKTAARE